MVDIIMETLLDGVKLLPFLFIAFFIIELLEHKLNNTNKKIISNSGKTGPIVGGFLGLVPQCGFSVMATNLYVTRIITLGTLISIYLSTSDEMLPILLSKNVDNHTIITILLIKVSIGIASGFIIDLVLKEKKKSNKRNYEICNNEHCHCKNGIIKSTIKHTVNTFIFIIIVSFLLNLLLNFVNEDYLSKIFLKNSVFGPFIASLIGLIPNCGASVMLTVLFLNNAISLGSTIAGLLTGSGVAVLVLFKTNKDLKENITILSIIYGIGVISGIIIEIIGMIF